MVGLLSTGAPRTPPVRDFFSFSFTSVSRSSRSTRSASFWRQLSSSWARCCSKALCCLSEAHMYKTYQLKWTAPITEDIVRRWRQILHKLWQPSWHVTNKHLNKSNLPPVAFFSSSFAALFSERSDSRPFLITSFSFSSCSFSTRYRRASSSALVFPYLP